MRRYFATLTAISLMLTLIMPARAQEASHYFPETGHTVAGKFLSYWQSHGELAQQGYPISDEMQEVSVVDGKTYTVQYFERSVFELHPEQTDPNYQVLLGLLGVEALKAKHPSGLPTGTQTEVVPGGGSFTFAPTGQTVTGLFLSYWQQHGGLAQQGLPITPAFTERNLADGKEYLTQYFERSRFEYHPEQSDPHYQVLLGLLGQEIYQAKLVASYTPTPAPATQTPAPVPATPTSAPRPSPTRVASNGCEYQVHPVFQFTVAHTSGLIERLGCPIDAGVDASQATHAGIQVFTKATLILLAPSGGGNVYAIKGNSYRRTGYTHPGGSDPVTGAGPHFSQAVMDFGGIDQIGIAVSDEQIGDGAVQNFEYGTLGYFGGNQMAYAFFPDTPTNLDHGTAFSYATR